jgi:hypothetical protein
VATSPLVAPDQVEDSVASALEPLRLHLLAACEASGGSPPDPFRGLHLAHSQVLEGLSGGVATLATTAATRSVADGLRDLRTGALLADLYDLTDFELAVVALALAPEIAPGFATAMAWLQDDLTRRLPTSSLALQLFCCDPPDPGETRNRLSPGAPLFARRLLSLPAAGEPLPARALVLDEQIRRLLLSEPGLDSRLVGWCRLTVPASASPCPLPDPLPGWLTERPAGPVHLSLGGRRGLGQDEVASALAAAAGSTVLTVDLTTAAGFGARAGRELCGVLAREALLLGATLDLAPAEALDGQEWLAPAVADVARLAGTSTVLRNGGSGPARALPGTGLVPIDLVEPDLATRRRLWTDAASRHGLALSEPDLDALALRYRLTPTDIHATVDRAAGAHRLGLGRPASHSPYAACAAQARSVGSARLAELATRIEPRSGWLDLVLPDVTALQLHELCDRAAAHARVLGDWGFASKLSLGRGLSALFAGPSGTGKSMAAEVIAAELGLDLFRVNLATVVDKYVGETEKNLDAVFAAAEDTNGILLFDEADALFGRRSEVRDAHDRYANLEISYLLQRIEQYDGLAILSTNLHANLDDAFLRRLAAIVWFPFPEVEQRAALWRQTWPEATPREALDHHDLATRFPLSGGGIKAAALTAAGLAQADGGIVTASQVRRAIFREYEKLGRTLTREELGEAAPEGSP